MAISKRFFRVARIVIVTAAVVSAGACSSASSTPTTSNSGGTGTDSSGVAKATALVNANEKPPSSIGVTTPVPGTIPGGKRIAFMECGLPACTQEVADFEQAASFLHWTVENINEGETAATVTNAWNQLVSNPPDAVVSMSQPLSETATQIAELDTKGVPVVGIGSLDQPHANILVVDNGAKDLGFQAELQAAIVADNSKGAGTAVWLSTPAFPVLVTAQNDFQSYLKQYCPSCGYKTLVLGATDIGSPTLPTKIVSYLRANPSVHYVVAGFDDELIGVPSALSEAGLSGTVKLVGGGPSVTELPYIKSGEEQWSLSLPEGEFAFLMADALARHFVHASVAPDQIVSPRQILTPASITSLTQLPDVPNYAAQFEALWTTS
ncbi:MAG: substrate-binding domain-containing protein [Acidimicrobiales bacterium]